MHCTGYMVWQVRLARSILLVVFPPLSPFVFFFFFFSPLLFKEEQGENSSVPAVSCVVKN